MKFVSLRPAIQKKMKLAISNIAWKEEEDPQVIEIMRDLGISALEVAPTRFWEEPLEASAEEVLKVRRFWEEQEIRIVAMQALLFGKPELTIFENPETREETLQYLIGIIKLAKSLGCGALVFGSPKNRRVGDIPEKEVQRIAEEFFGRLGEESAKYGIWFCLEPNPPDYGCDFVTTTEEAVGLVSAIGKTGLGLNFDLGGATINKEPLERILPKAAPVMHHFHISAPNLELITESGGDHALVAKLLKEIGYNRIVSIEMRSAESNLDRVRESIQFVKDTYAIE